MAATTLSLADTGTMDYPEGQAAESAEILNGSTATQSHGGSNAVGIGGGKVEGTVATEAHAIDINAGGIDVIVLGGPVNDFHYLVGIPRLAGILRRHDKAVDAAPAGHGINGAVALHLGQVSAAQAAAMEEDKQRITLIGDLRFEAWGFAFHPFVHLRRRRGVEPEVVGSGHRAHMGSEALTIDL